jgi:hypothetical protein
MNYILKIIKHETCEIWEQTTRIKKRYKNTLIQGLHVGYLCIMEQYWEADTKVLADKPVPVPLCPPQIPHGLTF